MSHAQVVDAWVLAVIYLLDNNSTHYKDITDYIMSTGLTVLGKKGSTPSQTVGAILRAKKLSLPGKSKSINLFDS